MIVINTCCVADISPGAQDMFHISIADADAECISLSCLHQLLGIFKFGWLSYVMCHVCVLVPSSLTEAVVIFSATQQRLSRGRKQTSHEP